jgi:hypothetical protein
MLNFSSLSLSREKSKDTTTSIDDDDKQASSSNNPFSRGRALSLTRSRSREESSTKEKEKDKEKERSGRSRTRSTSPFRRRGWAHVLRDPSPAVEALRMSQSEAELSEAEDAESQYSSTTVTNSGQHRKRRSWGIVPRRSSFWKNGSDSDSSDTSSEDESDDDTIRSPPPEWDPQQQADFNLSSTSLGSIDLLTEANTEKNAMLGFDEDGEPLYPIEDGDVFDPLGEGVNVVRPEEPVFGPQPAPKAGSSPSGPTARHTPSRKETIGRSTRLPLDTSRPSFSRDRCTLTLTHGDPAGYPRDAAADGDKVREPKRYVVASDLSTESGYAVEWGIGTVLRDGDTM